MHIILIVDTIISCLFTGNFFFNQNSLYLLTLITFCVVGLRSIKLGVQCEAVVKFPRLFERYPFPILINSAFLKLADVFRVADAFKEGWIVNSFLKLEVTAVDSHHAWNTIVLPHFLSSFLISSLILGFRSKEIFYLYFWIILGNLPSILETIYWDGAFWESFSNVIGIWTRCLMLMSLLEDFTQSYIVMTQLLELSPSGLY